MKAYSKQKRESQEIKRERGCHSWRWTGALCNLCPVQLSKLDICLTYDSFIFFTRGRDDTIDSHRFISEKDSLCLSLDTEIKSRFYLLLLI